MDAQTIQFFTEITGISEVADESYAEDFSETLVKVLEEKNILASPGSAVDSLIVKPLAIAAGVMRKDFDDALKNLSIATAEDDYARVMLANLNMYEGATQQAQGTLLLYTDQEDDMIIRQGTIFSDGTNTYALSRDYRASLNYASTNNQLYIPLTKLSDGLYVARVEASTTEGVASSVPAGVVLSVVNTEIRTCTKVETGSSFLASKNATLDDLREQASVGLTPQVLSSPVHVENTLLSSDELSVLDARAIGIASADMTRGAAGGCMDVFVKTSISPETLEISGTAERQDDGKYKMIINRDAAPGFYRVTRLFINDSWVYVSPDDFTYGADIGDVPFNVELGSPIYKQLPILDDLSISVSLDTIGDVDNARFSRYQNVVLSFELDSTDDSVSCIAEVSYMPGIDTIQNFVNDPSRRNGFSDIMIKAAIGVPLEISLNVTVYTGYVVPSENDIKLTILDIVNNKPIGTSFFSASEIVFAIQSKFEGVVVKLPMLLDAVVSGKDDKSTLIREPLSGTLELPYSPENGLGPNSVFFYTTPDKISVKMETDTYGR
jgi:hypothetical protein